MNKGKNTRFDSRGSGIQRLFCCFICLLLFEAMPTAAAAQSVQPSVPNTAPASLKDLSVEEVLKQFGPPDEKKQHSNDRESWFYGRSMIFFNQGKVSAWSNAGEISSRKNLAQIQAPAEEASPKRAENWLNDWTPNTAHRAQDEVLEELTDDNQSVKAPQSK